MDYFKKTILIMCIIGCILLSIFYLSSITEKTDKNSNPTSKEEVVGRMNKKLKGDLFSQLDLLDYQYVEESDTIYGKVYIEKDKLKFSIKRLKSAFMLEIDNHEDGLEYSRDVNWWEYDKEKIVFRKYKERGYSLFEKKSLFNIRSWFKSTRERIPMFVLDSAIIYEDVGNYILLICF